MSEIAVQPKRSTGLLIWMIVAQLLAVGSLLIWLVMAGLSVMAFDAGETPAAWAFVIAVWSYPIFPLGMSIGAWIAYARRKSKLAAILSGVSFAPPILFVCIMWLASFS
jgi:O-antigen/teichoic acid export membrane protein